MELALSLEKLTNEKLLHLQSVSYFTSGCYHCCTLTLLSLINDKIIFTAMPLFNVFSSKQVACKCNDPQMADFVESEFLGEQVRTINMYFSR